MRKTERQYKIRFSFTVDQILTFGSNLNMVREVKNRLQVSNNSHDDLLRY